MSAINQISNINFIINNYSKVIPTSNKDNIKDLLEFRNLFDGVRSSTVKVKNTEQDQKKVKDLYEKFAKWFEDNQLNENKIKEILEQVKNGNNKETFLQGYKLTLFFDFCYRIQDTYKDDFEKTSDKKFKEAGMSENKDDIDQLVKNYVIKKNENGESIQDEFKNVYTVDSNLQNNGIEIFPSLLVRTADVYSQLNKTRILYTDKKVDSIKEFDKIIDSYIKIINSDNLKALEKSEEFKQIVSQASIKTELTKFFHQILQENTSVKFQTNFSEKNIESYLAAIKKDEHQHDNIKKSIENSQTLQAVSEKFSKVESYLDKKTDYDPLAKYNTVVSENISTFNKVAKDLNNTGDNFFNEKDSDLTDNAFLQYGCLKLAQAHLKALDKLPETIDTKNIVKPDTANLKKIDEKISDLEKRITELEGYYNKNLKDKVSEFTPKEKEDINTYLQNNKKYWQLLEYLKGISLIDFAVNLNQEMIEVADRQKKVIEENNRANEKNNLKEMALNYQKALNSLEDLKPKMSDYGLIKSDFPTLPNSIRDLLDSNDRNDPTNESAKASLEKLKDSLEKLLYKMQNQAKINAEKGYGKIQEAENFQPNIWDNALNFPNQLQNIKNIIDNQLVNKNEKDLLSVKVDNFKRAYERLGEVSGNAKYGLSEFIPVLPDTLAKAFDQDKNNDPTTKELENAFRTAETSVENALSLMKKQAEKNKNYGGNNFDSFSSDIQDDASDAVAKIDQIIKIIDAQEIKKLEKQAAEKKRNELFRDTLNAYDQLKAYDEKDDKVVNKIPDIKIEINGKVDSWPNINLSIIQSLANDKGDEFVEKVKNAINDLISLYNSNSSVDQLPKNIDALKLFIEQENPSQQVTLEYLTKFVIGKINSLQQAKLLTNVDDFIKTVDRVPQYNFPVLAAMYVQILETLGVGDFKIEYNPQRDEFFQQMIIYLKSWNINVDKITLKKPNSKEIVLSCTDIFPILTAIKGIFSEFEQAGLVDFLNLFDQWQYKDGQVIANEKDSWDYILNTGLLSANLTMDNITKAYARYNEIINDQQKFKKLIPNSTYQLNFEKGIKQKLATLSYLLLKNKGAILNKEIINSLEKDKSEQGREFLNLIKTVGFDAAIFEVVQIYNLEDESTKKQWQIVFETINLPHFIEEALKYNLQKLIFNSNFKSILTFDKDKMLADLDQKDLEEFVGRTDKNSDIYQLLTRNVANYDDTSLEAKVNQLAVIYPYILTQLSPNDFDFVSNLKVLGVDTLEATNANSSRKVTCHLYKDTLIIQADDLNKVLKIDDFAKNIKLSITKEKLEELGLTAQQIDRYASLASKNKDVFIFSKNAKTAVYADLLKANDQQDFKTLLKLLQYLQQQELNQSVYLTLDQKGQHYLSNIPMDRNQDVRLDLGKILTGQMIDLHLSEKLNNTVILTLDQKELKRFNEYFLVAVNKEEFNNMLLDEQLAVFFEEIDNKLYFKKELLDQQIFDKALSLVGLNNQHDSFAKLNIVRNLYLQRTKFFEFNRQTGELFLKDRPDQQEIENFQHFVGNLDSPVIRAMQDFSDYNFLGENYLQLIDQINDKIFEESSDIRDLVTKKDKRNYDPILDFYSGYYDSKNTKINNQNNVLGDNRRIVALTALVAFIVAGPIKRGKDRNQTIGQIIDILRTFGKQWWGTRMFTDVELDAVQELLQKAHLPEYGLFNDFSDQHIIALINSEPEFKNLFTGLLGANSQTINKVAYNIWNKMKQK